METKISKSIIYKRLSIKKAKPTSVNSACFRKAMAQLQDKKVR